MSKGRNLPGSWVFTCLSHDIIAHEVSHALLDTLRTHFTLPPIRTSRPFTKRWPTWWRSFSISVIATCWSARLRSPGATCSWRRC